MVRLVPIRDGGVPETLIVLREGVQTLDDVVLAQACERALGEIGVPGPHWTVVVPDPSPAAFALARTLFRGPIDNPAYEGRRP